MAVEVDEKRRRRIAVDLIIAQLYKLDVPFDVIEPLKHYANKLTKDAVGEAGGVFHEGVAVRDSAKMELVTIKKGDKTDA